MVLFLFLMLLIYELYPIYSQNVEGDTCFHKATNSQGVCLLLINCTYAFNGVLNQVEPQVCRLADTAPIVCCPIDTIPSTSTARSGPASKSLQKCIQYSKRAKQDQCMIKLGISTVEHSTALLGEFPHMAAILYEPIYVNDNTTYKCYGSLISEKFVLTPASCHFLPEKPIEVHLGVVSFTSTNGSNVQKFKIKKVTIHPMFTTKTYNDLALVELEEEVKFDQYVRPICLGNDLGWENETSVIAGWTYERSDLEKTSIDVRFDCQSSYGTHQYHLTESQICAKIKLVSTLFVGSPIQIRSKDVNCMYTLVAFVTFEQIYEYPAFLATVKHYREWIESVIWPDETPSTTAMPQRYRPVR